MSNEDFSEIEEEWMRNQFASLELYGTPTELRKNLNFQRFLSERDTALRRIKEGQQRAIEKWLSGI